MSYPRTYETAVASTDGALTPADWNAMKLTLDGFTPSGTFVSPYSFVISTDGTDTYASNAFQTVYGGPSNVGGVDGGDADAVIQAAIDHTEGDGGGTIYIKTGTYAITTGLTIDTAQVNLYGEGIQATKLTSTSAIDILYVNYAGTKIANLWISGEGSNNPTSGLKISKNNCVFDHVYVSGVNANVGILCTYWNNVFIHPIVVNCKTAVKLDTADANSNHFFGGVLYTNVLNGTLFQLNGGGQTHMYGTDFEGAATTTGIDVNYFNSNLRLFGPRFEQLNYGILWEGGMGDLDIIYAPFFAFVTHPFDGTCPANSRIYGSTSAGAVLENWGNSAGTGAQQIIAHGLCTTPSLSSIYLTNVHNGANPYLSAMPDATNIYVTAGVGLQYNWRIKLWC